MVEINSFQVNSALTPFLDADILSPRMRMALNYTARNYKRCRGVLFGMVTQPAKVELREIKGCTGIQVGPFSKAECREYIEKSANEFDLSLDVINQIVELSDGNPRIANLIGRSVVHGTSLDEVARDHNRLYGITDSLILPETEILTIARPQIRLMENQIISNLKKEPTSIHQLKPREFEELLADLLNDMGYEITLTPSTGDGGKDIIAEMETELGKTMCLVEAKKYRSDRKVGVELVRTLYGTVCHHNATSGMLVTTSSFTTGAQSFQHDHQYQLALKDFADVARWISNHGKNM